MLQRQMAAGLVPATMADLLGLTQASYV